MPTQLPSSFASAAAGQIRDSRASGRGDSVRGSGSGEWPRSNGTRTFRRPSTTPFNQTASANSADPSQSPADDVPLSSANLPSAHYEQTGPDRYSKDDLLNIYAAMPGSMGTDVSHLFVSSWNPNQVNGSSARGWGKSGDNPHVPQDPTVCWDPNGSMKPISLEAFSPEEREIFAGDVNSTLKIPQQGKEGGQGGGQNGRKTSISLANTGSHPMSSPSTASRPGTRRRETADTNPFPSASLASPTASRFSRDDWLPRRSTDLKEQIMDEPEEDTSTHDPPTRSQTFGLSRANTGGSAFSSTTLWSSTTAPTGGAFGNFALSTSAIGDKRFGSGSSRLAHLIPKESAENLIGKANDAANADQSRGWRARQRTDTDPFGSEGNVSGSAILGGAQDTSPTLNSQVHRGVFDTPVKGGTSDFGMAGLNLGHGTGNGPASPSETNPYRSPMGDRGDDGHEENDMMAQPGHGSEPPSHYGTLSRAFGATAFDGSDRSQTSSVGAKGFSAVNTLTGWPGAPSTGTPDRERQAFNSAFGGSIFSPLGDLQSPGLGGLGGVFGAPVPSAIGRGKLQSLFPLAMQAQMQQQDHESLSDSVPDLRQTNPLGAIGRGPIGAQPRDTGSPIRQTRFEDLFPNSEVRAAFTTADQSQTGLTSTAPGSSFPASAGGGSFSSAAPGSDPSAVRQMVMPDRMRWVYLDPQGTMQGPFNGLEMNDWYKANFFSPDLRVKRIEDADFEPLGQLIRRIGNSREPFLVPQMGIPHGPAPSGGFTVTGTDPVPPLQSAFPSFGRTLTAAQQNDLERRKQEEQLYHARQREIAHHHQAAYGRLPIQPGVPGALHHHSSAHSLQSQPSFGSMTSPIGAPQPPIGPLIPGSTFFESAPNVNLPQGQAQPGIGAAPDLFNPDLNINERQLLANLQASGSLGNIFSSQHAGAPTNDGGLRSQLPRIDQLQKDSEGFSTRVQDFHQLQSQPDAEDANAAAVIAAAEAEARADALDHDLVSTAGSSEVSASVIEVETRVEPTSKRAAARNHTGLSLTERVKKTQADAAAAAAAVAAAAVAKPSQQPSSSGLPMPFPPPASSTPIAAPTAQRPASNLPTRYDERSATGTPDTTSDGVALAPPPAAPWAGTESHKGPSLKEIQEAEAKKAAKQEEAAAALRRAALEQEAAALREREKAAAAMVGLPATSTWGTGSPVGTTTTGSPWKQPAAVKGNTASISAASAASKKTIADIQREEETRKRKALEAAAMQTAAASGAGLGKRYADLASKTSGPPGISAGAAAATQSVGGGWSTVGAGGKVKIPTGPAAQTRSASAASAASNTKTPVPAVAPKPAPKQVTIGLKDAKSMALEEFKKWLNRELVRGRVSDVDTFASVLLDSPLDSNLIADVAYSASQTLDGRHFADEFIRRKKLADRGVFDKDATSAAESKNSSNGGWNEVAKKGGSATPKEDTNIAGFRMVASKKGKGKKN